VWLLEWVHDPCWNFKHNELLIAVSLTDFGSLDFVDAVFCRLLADLVPADD
jgi:hypothetical protein